MEQRIINYVHNISWFVWEDENDMFATRQHGNVLEEEYSDIDYEEGLRVKKLLLEKFPETVFNVDIDVVDEWVLININSENE